jgi:aminopeptidase N
MHGPPQAHRRAPACRWVLLFLLLALPGWAAEKTRLRVDDYQIDAELTPHLHRLAAHVKVRFTALENTNVAIFQLHNDLRLNKVTDDSGKALSAERIVQDSTVRVQLLKPLNKDQSSSLNFDYDGVLESAEDSPVQGLKLAYVGDDTSYLLYAGRWFPVESYGTNRFTATMNITVPAHMTVIGSGQQSESSTPALKTATPGEAAKTYTMVWNKPSFPGSIVAGTFQDFKSNEAGVDLHVFLKPIHQNLGALYAETALKEFTYFVTLYGPAPSTTLRVVEIPDDTVPSFWAPEVAGIASRGVTEKVNYRLLANTIAHQWWGASVSPASIDDWWLCDGFARYSEARYVESAAGQAGLEEAVKDMSVGALAYDTVPLSTVGKLDLFSPEFQTLVTDKGGMILHMLRWVMGDQKYDQTMRAFAAKYAGKSASVDDFREVAEQNYGDKLTWFFSQWLDSTGAPEFKVKYTVYRLGGTAPPKNGSEKTPGFRIVGQINQDLDLFRMPVQLKIDTDGRTEEKRIEVVGTDSAFTIETFGKPRRISLDPNDQLLKNSPAIRLRADIQRGQGLVQQGDYAGALAEYNKALEVSKNSSLAHYRIAEVFFQQKNYQASANGYRDALNGDGEPRWTEVWSHVQLGKIFDITGQRERATNEYRQALQTNDNTQGALDEARRYLQKAYEQPKNKPEAGN